MLEQQSSSATELGANVPSRGKRLLVVTPYSPTKLHGHAADDLGRQLVEILSTQFELHVYASGQSNTRVDGEAGCPITYHAGTQPRTSVWRHFGIYPAGLRKDWSKTNTSEVRRLIERLCPDFVHVEYIQPVEAVSGQAVPWSLTLHDITSRVFQQRAARSKGMDRLYRGLEYLRIRRLEERVVREPKRVFTLSSRDALWIKSKAPSQAVSPLKIGITLPPETWSHHDCDPLSFIFAGAMWRDSNAAAATFLAREVMPLVWRRIPQAVLRIVGARPTSSVLQLAVDPRIQIVGMVESIEKEYLDAAAVLAPSLVDAGVLLKALRAMACGSPLIVNQTAANPLEVTDGVECYIRDSPEAIAEKMIEISTNVRSAEQVAAAGRAFVQSEFSWSRYGQDMTQGIGQ